MLQLQNNVVVLSGSRRGDRSEGFCDFRPTTRSFGRCGDLRMITLFAMGGCRPGYHSEEQGRRIQSVIADQSNYGSVDIVLTRFNLSSRPKWRDLGLVGFPRILNLFRIRVPPVAQRVNRANKYAIAARLPGRS